MGRAATTSTQSLDKRSPVPLYYQLFLRIQSDIQAGLARPGDLLGTEKVIQERYGVSRATVRKAFDELARAGRLVRITGRGTFVAEPTVDARSPHLLSLTEELDRRGITPGSQVLAFDVETPTSEAVEALGCRPTDQVLHIRRLRTGNGTPIVLVDHYLAPSLRLDCEDLQQSLYATLEGVLGVRLHEAYHTVQADVCSADEARLLEIAPEAVVLRFRRTTLATDSVPIVFECGLGRGDLYDYSVHLFRQYAS